jgi:hypothetical protein
MRMTAAMLVLLLGGCAAQSTQATWVRTDARRMSGDPALSAKFEADKAACEGQANVSLCMERRGYLSMPANQAEGYYQAGERAAKQMGR